MYICTDCYANYDREYLKEDKITGGLICPIKSCLGIVAEIDQLIAPTIILLNKRGYKTTFCCSGHHTESFIATYIAFDEDLDIPNTTPEGFYWETEEATARTSDIEEADSIVQLPVLRIKQSMFKSHTMFDKYDEINQINSNLFRWADTLENAKWYKEVWGK